MTGLGRGEVGGRTRKSGGRENCSRNIIYDRRIKEKYIFKKKGPFGTAQLSLAPPHPPPLEGPLNLLTVHPRA